MMKKMVLVAIMGIVSFMHPYNASAQSVVEESAVAEASNVLDSSEKCYYRCSGPRIVVSFGWGGGDCRGHRPPPPPPPPPPHHHHHHHHR